MQEASATHHACSLRVGRSRGYD